MLKHLSIRNYALISELEVDFGEGLTTLTGETGAGKSILLGALALLLGNRAETGVLQDPSRKCLVEGVFVLPAAMRDFFASHDLDPEQETIVRREISSGGKSRAFLNDTPVTLNVLKDFGDRMLDVHSQHQNLILARADYPAEVIDRFGELILLAESYRQQFDIMKDTVRRLAKLRDELTKVRSDQDYLEFQLKQLDDARLQQGEQDELESERDLLSNAGDIHERLFQSVYRIDGEDASLLMGIKSVMSDLQAISAMSPAFVELRDRLEGLYIELADLNRELEGWVSRVEQNPERLRFAEQRLDLIYSLQQKHQVKSVEELISLAGSIRERLQAIEVSDEEVVRLESEYNTQRQQVHRLASALTEARKRAVPSLESAVSAHLKELGIPHARFMVEWKPAADFQPNGMDILRFLFSANKNQTPEEISKVASGGEISRLMLAIKTLISDSNDIPTLIFDEIDAGVSGEIAHRMGSMILSIASGRQVINITHLPQVAALGHHHFLVYKFDDDHSTRTAIRALDSEERIGELAKMLSGDRVTEEAIRNARVLLGK